MNNKDIVIKLNGKVFTELELMSIDIWCAHQKLSKAKIKFLDLQNEYHLSKAIGATGAELEIYLDAEGKDETLLFRGHVLSLKTKLLNNRKIYALKAKSKLHSLTVNKKSKIYKNQREEDVFNDVLEPYNGALKMKDNSEIKEDLIQFQTSDWDFLNLRAEVNASFLYEKNGMVILHKLNSNQSDVISIKNDRVIHCELDCNGVNGFEGVSNAHWDLDKDNISENKSEKGATHPLIKDWDIKKQQDWFKEQEIFYWSNNEDINGSDHKMIWNEYSMLNGTLCIQGDLNILPGQILDLSSIHPQLNAKAIIGGVHNQWEQQHFYTYLSLGLKQNEYPQELKSNRAINNNILIGKVQSYEDDVSGHYKVALTLNHPEFQNQWVSARVLQVSKGVHAFPDIGSWVVVGFIYGDMKDPVVLGTFYDNNNPPPFDLNNENQIKGLLSNYGFKMAVADDDKSLTIVSPNGLNIIYNDEKKSFQFEDPHGNHVQFDKEGISFKSVKDLSFECEGEMKLSAQKNIKMEGKQNIENESQEFKVKTKGKLNLEGMQATLKGQSLCEIKASMVKIN